MLSRCRKTRLFAVYMAISVMMLGITQRLPPPSGAGDMADAGISVEHMPYPLSLASPPSVSVSVVSASPAQQQSLSASSSLISTSSLSSPLMSSFSSFSILHALAQRRNCEQWNFPDAMHYGFFNQPDNTKVYRRVDKIDIPDLVSAGLDKYITVFGIRVLADPEVSDHKILHVGAVLAELLDVRQRGRPSNQDLVETLHYRNAYLVVLDSDERIEELFQRLPPAYECHLFIIPEIGYSIQPGGVREKDCPDGIRRVETFPTTSYSSGGGGKKKNRNNYHHQFKLPSDVRAAGTGNPYNPNRNDFLVDKTVGYIAYFLIHAGYPTNFPANSEQGRALEQAFHDSIRNKWFQNNEFDCDDDCQRMEFQAWAFTSALGHDSCSCRENGQWKLCTEKEMMTADPALYATLTQGIKQPDGHYTSSAVLY